MRLRRRTSRCGRAVNVSADDVLRQLEAVVMRDLPAELARVNEAKGINPPLAPPAVYEQLPDPLLALRSTAQFPALAFTSAGLAENPQRQDKRTSDAVWECTVTCFVRGGANTYRATATAVREYVAAVRLVVARAQRLGGVCDWVDWADEDYAALADDDSARTLGAGFVTFDVHVPGALDASLPPEPPYTDDGPLLQQVDPVVTPRKD